MYNTTDEVLSILRNEYNGTTWTVCEDMDYGLCDKRLLKGGIFYRDWLLHTSHITHHTSHITHHTSHITHHTSHITHPVQMCNHCSNGVELMHQIYDTDSERYCNNDDEDEDSTTYIGNELQHINCEMHSITCIKLVKLN